MSSTAFLRFVALPMLWWLAGPSHATSPECGQSVQVVRDVKACSAEAFNLDRKVDATYGRLIVKFREDTNALDLLRASQIAWRQYLNAQCVFEQELPLSELKLRMQSASKFRRSGIDCAKELLMTRIKELEAL